MTEPFPNICPQCLVLLSHLRRGLMACGALLWIQSILYGSALVDQLGEGERIPVGKPNAAMRFGFAHVLQLWRAVNSITLGRDVDPHRQHRRRQRLFETGSRSTWRRFSLGAIRSRIRWRQLRGHRLSQDLGEVETRDY